MLVVELAGATVGRTFEDNTKIKPSSASELYVYEIPDYAEETDSSTDCEIDYSDELHGESAIYHKTKV